MENIERIVIQFEHQIFTIENGKARELLNYIEMHCNIYSDFEWNIIDRKPLRRTK